MKKLTMGYFEVFKRHILKTMDALNVILVAGEVFKGYRSKLMPHL